MEDTKTQPILDADGWLRVVDNTEEGEEIPAPLGMIPFMRGTLTVLGAETFVGKTALGLQSYRWVVDQGRSAAYCTLEMSPALLFKRFWPQFGSEEACREWIRDNDAHVSHSYLDYQGVESIVRSGYEFVVIDHIHELPFDGHEDLARKVKRIASRAPETKTAILMLAQLKQRDPTFDPGPPSMYDFSWTKTIPEVASVAQCLWKPDPDAHGEVELITLKNRYGGFLPEPMNLKMNPATIEFERNTLW
jgi:hypothetical protein